MATYFGLWKVNDSLPPPPTPAEQIKQAEAFDGLIRAQLKSGRVREVHSFLDGGRGYFITGDVSEEEIAEELALWAPFLTFELHQTIPFPKASEIFLKAARRRAGKA